MAELLGLESCAITDAALGFRGPRLHLGSITRAAPVDAGICDRFLTSINRLQKFNVDIDLYSMTYDALITLTSFPLAFPAD